MSGVDVGHRSAEPPVTLDAFDVAVVGGGIVGCAAALELARGGASVVLFEATAIGAGASGRNSGSVQHPFDEALAPLHQASLERYRRLAEEASESFAFPIAPAGLLLLAAEAEWADLEAEHAAVAEAAAELEPTILTPAELAALEPGLAPDLAAVRVETAYPVPPAAAVGAFARLAEQAGTRIEIGQPATIELHDGEVVGARIAGGTVTFAGSVLIAAGPWSPEVVDPTGRWRPIARTWGVTVATTLAEPPRHVLEQIGVASVNRAVGLAENDERGPPVSRPAPGVAEPKGRFGSTFSLVTAAGVSVVGSTFLPHEPDPGSVGPLLLHRADRFVPGLHAAGVDELRACARPQSLDGRPLVGRVPGYVNLFIAAGHGPWGISTGPATAGLVADLILGRPVTIPRELAPDRFAS